MDQGLSEEIAMTVSAVTTCEDLKAEQLCSHPNDTLVTVQLTQWFCSNMEHINLLQNWNRLDNSALI
jgi:hypothetical protein